MSCETKGQCELPNRFVSATFRWKRGRTEQKRRQMAEKKCQERKIWKQTGELDGRQADRSIKKRVEERPCSSAAASPPLRLTQPASSLTYSDGPLLVCRWGPSHISFLTHLMWNPGVKKKVKPGTSSMTRRLQQSVHFHHRQSQQSEMFYMWETKQASNKFITSSSSFWVSSSIRLMSSMVKPTHLSIQQKSWRWKLVKIRLSCCRKKIKKRLKWSKKWWNDAPHKQ